MEFQVFPSSCMKQFFILLVLGFGKQTLYENKLLSNLRPISFNIVYIIFALAFFLFMFSDSQPSVRKGIEC